MGFPERGDERRHAPSHHPWWEEAWDLDFATDDASFGGHVRLGILPNQGVSWVWAAVVGDGRRLVTVVEHEAPIPRPGSLDLRCEGLWVDLVCEEPLEHWSVGLEAFGVALDEPADALRGLRGERIGVGLDLGWQTVGTPRVHAGGDGYNLRCDAAGEVLVGDEIITFDGWGSRSHTWGKRERRTVHPTLAGRLSDGTRWEVGDGFALSGDGGTHGFPTGAVVDVDDLSVRLDIRHLSPVPVATSDGTHAVAFHGLCTTTTADGRRGAAWLRADLDASSPAPM